MLSRHKMGESGPNPERRRLLALAGFAVLGASTLGGCGFRPVYGRLGAGADEQLARIDVSVIAEREGQQLRTFLIRMLNPSGRPTSPDYRLSVTLSESLANLAVQDGRTGTRRNLTLIADYDLTALGDGEGTTGRIRTITSYNRQTDEFATLSAERDARERALVQTAQDIRIALATHFAAPPSSTSNDQT